MAIGAIIGTSLSYALQLSSAGHIGNAGRFDNKAGPFVGSIMETIMRMQIVSKTPCRRRWIVSNGLMCGSTVRKIHGVAIRKSSEITELSGSNGVRTFRRSWSSLAGT